MNGIKANARIRVEQDVHLVLKNPILNNLGHPYDEVITTRDPLYKHYKVNEDRIIHKDGPPFRNFLEKLAMSNTIKFLW